MTRAAGPPLSPVAHTGRPRVCSTRATFTPLPPGSRTTCSAVCDAPTASLPRNTSVVSTAAFSVTVRIGRPSSLSSIRK